MGRSLRKRKKGDSFSANQVKGPNSSIGGGPDAFEGGLELGEVVDVITSSEDDAYQEEGDIGKAKVRRIRSDYDKDPEQVGYMQPMDSRVRAWPVKYELVLVFDLHGILYYSTTANWKSNIVQNAAPEYGSSKVERDKGQTYQDSEDGIPKGGGSSADLQIPDFKVRKDVNPLFHRIGDVVFEGRFGSSLVLGRDDSCEPLSWMKAGQRSREGEYEFPNINETPSSLLLTGPDTVSPINEDDVVFDPATSEFDDHLFSADRSRTDYGVQGVPEAYLTSGRVVLNAKSDELVGFSKLDMNLVTEADFTVDAKSRVRTFSALGHRHETDRDFQVLAEGDILVGTADPAEPVARGQETHDRLVKLLETLLQESHPTPCGPSGPPLQQAEYNQIMELVKQLVRSEKVFVDSDGETYNRS